MAAPTITIIPGFGEGRWHTRILMASLATLGYREERIAARADVIITHSAGCFFLPNTAANQLIILIGPPYWPGKPLLLSLVQKLWGDFATSVRRRKLGFWAHKVMWNYLYIGTNLLRVLRIALGARRQKFHEALRGKPVAIIRNDDDSWLSPDAARMLPADESFAFYHLPGQHEDCWVYPDEHAALIDKIITQKGITT